MKIKLITLFLLFVLIPFFSYSQDKIELWLRKQTSKETFNSLYSMREGFMKIFPNLKESDIDPVIKENIDSVYEETIHKTVLIYKQKFPSKELSKIVKMNSVEFGKKYSKEIAEILKEQNSFVQNLSSKYYPRITKELRIIDFHKEKFSSDSCIDFKFGEFKVLNIDFENTIRRYDDIQIETFRDFQSEFKVRWTSSCSYTLELINTTFEDAKPLIGSLLEVKIFKIDGDVYKIKAYSKQIDDAFIMEVKKVK